MVPADFEVRPGHEVPWEDLVSVFGPRGMPGRCGCQRYRLARGESFAAAPDEVRMDRLREQLACGDDRSPTAGLVGYLAGEPVGWCAVQPRTSYAGLVRNDRATAWSGRDEDRTDSGVWAITCLVTRAGHRRQGLATAMVPRAVEHARAHGARAVEGYPMTTADAILVEMHPGTESMFRAAGFGVVARPSRRRAVMRLDLVGGGAA